MFDLSNREEDAAFGQNNVGMATRSTFSLPRGLGFGHDWKLN